MNNDYPKELLDQLWRERGSEINNIVRKNFFGYVFIISILGLVFLIFSSVMMGNRFPTKPYFWFAGGYSLLAVITYRIVSSEEHKGNKSGRNRYLILMAWFNLFVFLLSLLAMCLTISGWLSSDLIQIRIYNVFLLLLFIILIIIWWVPKKLMNELNKYTKDNSEKKQLSPIGYIWIIGFIILLSNLVSNVTKNYPNNVRYLLLVLISSLIGMWFFAQALYLTYRDYIFLKSGYLD
jgi:magnesium-transporting ATPase (P-type)